jgi:hypothetical protein
MSRQVKTSAYSWIVVALLWPVNPGEVRDMMAARDRSKKIPHDRPAHAVSE